MSEHKKVVGFPRSTAANEATTFGSSSSSLGHRRGILGVLLVNTQKTSIMVCTAQATTANLHKQMLSCSKTSTITRTCLFIYPAPRVSGYCGQHEVTSLSLFCSLSSVLLPVMKKYNGLQDVDAEIVGGAREPLQPPLQKPPGRGWPKASLQSSLKAQISSVLVGARHVE